MVVGTKTGEKFRFMDGISNPTANAGDIVKNQQRWYTADKFKDIQKPLADTLGGFPAKSLSVAIITIRERYRKIFLSA